jgi:hypothetical protein
MHLVRSHALVSFTWDQSTALVNIASYRTLASVYMFEGRFKR